MLLSNQDKTKTNILLKFLKNKRIPYCCHLLCQEEWMKCSILKRYFCCNFASFEFNVTITEIIVQYEENKLTMLENISHKFNRMLNNEMEWSRINFLILFRLVIQKQLIVLLEIFETFFLFGIQTTLLMKWFDNQIENFTKLFLQWETLFQLWTRKKVSNNLSLKQLRWYKFS
jgi:hypothetical protein